MKVSKWQLPTVIDPPETVCVQIEIPNDFYHIAAFWGALEELAKAYRWRDSYVGGSAAAYVWRDIIDYAANLVRIGDNCMSDPFDCTDVELCLATSDIIAALQTQITNNANGVSTNNALITTNTNAIGNQATLIQNNADQILINQTNIGNNANDIIDVETALTILTNRVTVNEGDITDLETNLSLTNVQVGLNADDIDDLELDAAQQALTLIDHEARIAMLEGGGVGGGGFVKVLETVILDDTGYISVPSPGWQKITDIPDLVVDLNGQGLTQVHYQLACYTNGKVSFRVTDGTAISEVRSFFTPNVLHYDAITFTAEFEDLSEGSHTFWLELREDSGQSFIPKSRIIGTVWEIAATSTPPILTDPIVTFDPDTAPYSLTVGQKGLPSANGNPDLCLAGDDVEDPDFIEIQVDLGIDKPINNVILDYYTSDHVNTNFQIYIDDVYFGGGLALDLSDVWDEHNALTDDPTPPPFPTSGRLVRIRLKASFAATIADLRFDNIFIDTD